MYVSWDENQRKSTDSIEERRHKDEEKENNLSSEDEARLSSRGKVLTFVSRAW